MSIQTWVEGVIKDAVKVAVDEAMADANAAIVAEIQSVETNLTAQITSLPGLVGSQIQNVAVDAGAVATNVLAGLSSLPQQIITGVIQGLNPFKGER